MKQITHRATALAAFTLCAIAQAESAAAQAKPSPDPADPNAPVPQVQYVPLPHFQAATMLPGSPADNWKELNRIVGTLDSMSHRIGSWADEDDTLSQRPRPGLRAQQ